MVKYVLPLLMVACNLPALPSAYVVKDLRVIAFIMEPPEVAPGQTVTMTAWYYDPSGGGRDVQAMIYRCDEDDEADCLFFEDDAPRAEVLAEGSAENVATDLYRFQTTVTIPADALTGADVIAQFYGKRIVYVTRARNDQRFIDGLKRLTVSSPMVPKNKNPSFKGFMLEVDGKDLGDDTAVTALSRDTRYVVRPLFDPAVLETYFVRDFSGEVLTFVEEASFTWSCSPDCSVDQRVTFNQDIVTITPPLLGAENDRFAIQVLMRDGRGGEALLVRDFTLLPETVKTAPE